MVVDPGFLVHGVVMSVNVHGDDEIDGFNYKESSSMSILFNLRVLICTEKHSRGFLLELAFKTNWLIGLLDFPVQHRHDQCPARTQMYA
jgi:hypothetical protein